VFHLAAYQNYLTDFSTFALVNDTATALLYEIIVKDSLPVEKVVLASSQAVYGEGKYECPEHGIQYPLSRRLDQLEKKDWEIKCPVCQGELKLLKTDEAVVNPHNQYAISKYSQEMYSLVLGRRYDIPTAAMRYSITQGPRQSFYNAYSGILRIFSTRLLNNMAPVVYEDGRQLRDYVHVHDVAAANVLALESDEAAYEAYNVGGNNVLTVLEYADLLIKHTGKDTGVRIDNQFRFGDTRHIVSDISKLRKLGWNPDITIDKIIEDYLNWVKEYPGASEYYTQAEEVMKQRGVIREARQ
jgi:dTDP-L-rhamnose 4-epimerase